MFKVAFDVKGHHSWTACALTLHQLILGVWRQSWNEACMTQKGLIYSLAKMKPQTYSNMKWPKEDVNWIGQLSVNACIYYQYSWALVSMRDQFSDPFPPPQGFWKLQSSDSQGLQMQPEHSSDCLQRLQVGLNLVPQVSFRTTALQEYFSNWSMNTIKVCKAHLPGKMTFSTLGSVSRYRATVRALLKCCFMRTDRVFKPRLQR